MTFTSLSFKQAIQDDLTKSHPGEARVTTRAASGLTSVISFVTTNFRVVLLVIMGIQVLKGTAVYQAPYARAHYLWNYDVGLIKRGLIGAIAMYFSEGDEYRLLGVINFISYFSFFLFLFVLYNFILRHARDVSTRFISLLFASSPLILGMGTLLGYYDSLFLILLMLTFDLCRRNKVSYFTSFVLVSTALLIHELSIFFVILPFLFQIWINPSLQPAKKLLLLGMICLTCLLFLGFIFVKNGSFDQLLSMRLDQYAHSLSTKSGESTFIKYGNYAIRNNFLHDFDTHRLKLLEAFFPVYGIFIFVASLIGTITLIRLKKVRMAILFAVMCYLPLAIIVVAWDIERFICLASCTTYVCYLSILNIDVRIAKKASRSWLYLSILGIIITTSLTYYPIAEFYAESETIISKKRQSVLLQYPKKYIQSWFDKKPSPR